MIHCWGRLYIVRPLPPQVKFDVNRADKHIIQSIAILDMLDKDINTFAMRVREWYSWHFPELLKVVSDNYQYARLVLFIKKRDSISKESLPAIEEITLDATKAQQVLDASKHSMGQSPSTCTWKYCDGSSLTMIGMSPHGVIELPALKSVCLLCVSGMEISDIDLLNVYTFAERVIALSEYRVSLQTYLHTKMGLVAPNLQSLIGDQVSLCCAILSRCTDLLGSSLGRP